MSENLNPIVLEVEEVRVVNAVSPTVDLGRTDTGALVTVHDYRGTQTVEILDGPVGPVGPQGPQGESGAETAKAIVEEAISRMEDSIHDAQTIGQTVAGYRDAAAQSASNAALSKDAAAQSAQAAEQSNQSSSGYARTAGEQAENAAQSAQDASQSASAADTSAHNAAQSETNAGNSASAASQSAQAASQSASNAAQSATDAADSAQDAHDVLDSIPADYSTLSSDVTDIKSAITEQSYNLYTGKIAGATIASNGKIGASELFDMFKAPVEAGKTYSIRLKDTTASTFIGWFETEPTAIRDVSYNAARVSVNNGIAVTAPITGWIAYREDIGFDQPQVNEGGTLLPYVASITAIDSVSRAKLSALDGVETGSMHISVTPSITTGVGYYIKSNGVKTSNANFNLSDPIDLAPGFTIAVNAAGSTFANSVAIIASVSNGVYTPLVLNASGTTSVEYTYTAQTVERIVLSYLVSAGIAVSIAGNIITAINLVGESVSTMDNHVAGTPLSMFTDIVCCGDSLTYSAVFTDSTHHRQAFVPWPTQIARVYGIPTDIKADSGKNPKTWFADYGDTIAQSSAGNRLYITYFGHNASTQYPYTDTFETDCPADADPSTWADTLTGWWGRIINDIYAAGCKALIIRVSDSNGYRAIQDAIIEDIAARWNVPVIDNPYLPDLIYHSATDSYANEAHYNDLGYMAFCRQLMTNINKMSLTDLGHLLPSNS